MNHRRPPSIGLPGLLCATLSVLLPGLSAVAAAPRDPAPASVPAPEAYRAWGINPPRGGLLYGPPGNGKTLLAKAVATETETLFYHLRLTALTSRVGPSTGEVIKEVFQLAASEGKGLIFFEDADALSLEHILPPERAREAAAPLVISLCELLDGLRTVPGLLVLASTGRPDAIDAPLIAPGRLDHLVEV